MDGGVVHGSAVVHSRDSPLIQPGNQVLWGRGGKCTYMYTNKYSFVTSNIFNTIFHVRFHFQNE